jgi:hypothetical protein
MRQHAILASTSKEVEVQWGEISDSKSVSKRISYGCVNRFTYRVTRWNVVRVTTTAYA